MGNRRLSFGVCVPGFLPQLIANSSLSGVWQPNSLWANGILAISSMGHPATISSVLDDTGVDQRRKSSQPDFNKPVGIPPVWEAGTRIWNFCS